MHLRDLRRVVAVATIGLVSAGGAAPATADTGTGTGTGTEATSTYIVQVDPGAQSRVAAAVERTGGDARQQYSTAITGLAADLTPAQAAQIASRDDVTAVSPEHTFSISDTQSPADWDLDLLDQATTTPDHSYSYTSTAGAGVKVYVIDTGIAPTPQLGSRLAAGYSAVSDGGGTVDCNGHGTHVAGTVASTTYGVAKAATVVPVRVLGCDGSGTSTGVLSGISWILADHTAGTPAVVNMSIGGTYDTAVNSAVANLVEAGITVVVAAGNDGKDACSYSPASAPAAITVGATDAADARASFSNDGSCLDLFAPGVAITSLGLTSGTTATMSGTSMASPHVAGIAALYLGDHTSATPAQVTAAILAQAHPLVTGGLSPTTLEAAVAAVPGAPVNLRASPGTTTATLAWAAGTGVAPTSYRTTVKLSGASTPLTTVTTTAQGATLTGLTAGATYAVSVVAVADSGASTATTTTFTTTPILDTPTGVAAAATGTTTARVTWSGSATGYVVQTSSAGTTWATAATSTTTSATITGLTRGTTYWVRVAASGGSQTGTWSAPISFTIAILPVCVPPARPASAARVAATFTSPEGLVSAAALTSAKPALWSGA